MRAIFPESIAAWTDRRDSIDTIWANDPNALAAEVVAIENTLGVMPHVEKHPIMGSSKTYDSVDARISDIVQGNNIPVLSMSSREQHIHNWRSAGSNYGEWNSYNPDYDPFNMYNGTDVTIPADGWYHVSIAQSWDWWSTGYHGHWFWIDGRYYRHHHWFWDFDGNRHGGYWYRSEAEQRPSTTHIDWQGVLKKGQRLRVLSENGCPHTPHRAYDMSFALSFIRTVAASAPSSAIF